MGYEDFLSLKCKRPDLNTTYAPVTIDLTAFTIVEGFIQLFESLWNTTIDLQNMPLYYFYVHMMRGYRFHQRNFRDPSTSEQTESRKCLPAKAGQPLRSRFRPGRVWENSNRCGCYPSSAHIFAPHRRNFEIKIPRCREKLESSFESAGFLWQHPIWYNQVMTETA